LKLDTVSPTAQRRVARGKTNVFDRTFFKKLADSKGRAFSRSSQRAKLFIRESAFAGEFFNPRFGLKKRGLL